MFFKKLLMIALMSIHFNASEKEALENKLKDTRIMIQNVPYNKELVKYFPFLIKDPRIGKNGEITCLDSPVEIIYKFASYYVKKQKDQNILKEIEQNQKEIDKLIKDKNKKQLFKITNNLHEIFEEKLGQKYYKTLNKKMNLDKLKNIYLMKNNLKSDENRNEIKLSFEFLDSIKKSLNEKDFERPKNQNMKIFAIFLLTGIVILYFYSSKKADNDLEKEITINNYQ